MRKGIVQAHSVGFLFWGFALGRVSTFSQAIADRICERISEGEPLRVICRDPKMPAWRTVYDWIATHDDFAARIARARDLGGDAIAEDVLEIIDAQPERCATEFGDKVDPGFVQWQKNRADKRLELLAKWNPGKYGNKIDVNHSGTIELANRLEAARQRVNGDGTKS